MKSSTNSSPLFYKVVSELDFTQNCRISSQDHTRCKAFFCLVVIFILIISACTDNETREIKPVSSKQPVVIVISYDISRSPLTRIPPPDAQSLEKLADFVTVNKGVIVFGRIGNTSTSDMPFVRFDNLSLDTTFPTVETLSARTRQIRECRERVASYKAARRDFADLIMNECRVRKDAWTNLNAHFRRVNTFLEEPSYNEYRKIFICISDGIHSMPDSTSTLNVKISPEVNICTVGWYGDCKNALGENTKSFESLQGAIGYVIKQYKQ